MMSFLLLLYTDVDTNNVAPYISVPNQSNGGADDKVWIWVALMDTMVLRATLHQSCRTWPCPHDTFPNRSRSIANGSRPVARVHTGETGTSVPVSPEPTSRPGTSGREPFASGRLCRVDARPGASARPR